VDNGLFKGNETGMQTNGMNIFLYFYISFCISCQFHPPCAHIRRPIVCAIASLLPFHIILCQANRHAAGAITDKLL